MKEPLLERLRDPSIMGAHVTMGEAADRIEKLQTALKDLQIAYCAVRNSGCERASWPPDARAMLSKSQDALGL